MACESDVLVVVARNSEVAFEDVKEYLEPEVFLRIRYVSEYL